MKINKTYSTLLVFCQFNAAPSEFFWHNFDTIQRIFWPAKGSHKKIFFRRNLKIANIIEIMYFKKLTYQYNLVKCYFNLIYTSYCGFSLSKINQYIW